MKTVAAPLASRQRPGAVGRQMFRQLEGLEVFAVTQLGAAKTLCQSIFLCPPDTIHTK